MKTVSIRVTDPKNGEISENIYGQFIEHLEDCIYGGLWDDDLSRTDERHIRKDVKELVRGLAPTLLRFPGGCAVAGYHWEDAIGPLSERKTKRNLISRNTVLRPEFGTAEFIEYCRELHIEPMICVNISTGTAEEAANWVEYCNGTTDSYYANLRRQHGYEEPFNVKYWCIGNECYAESCIGLQSDVSIYARDARQFIKCMKIADPTIEVIVVGCDEMEGWNRPMLDGIEDISDYFSYHFYGWEGDQGFYGPFAMERFYLEKMKEIEELLASYGEKTRKFNRWYSFPSREKKLRIFVDEWNIWETTKPDSLHMHYNWRDAVWVASLICRYAADENIAGANMAQLCNVLAPIFTRGDRVFAQTIYTPCAKFRTAIYGERRLVEVENPFMVDGKAAGEIEGVIGAAAAREGKLYVALVNRDFGDSVQVKLPFAGEGTVYYAEDGMAQNDVDVDVVKSIAFHGSELELPPGSFALLSAKAE